ncbi:MAG: VWA domain-containing protein [Pirellulales bacterium]|jgi:Ca-activated chloride channel family protein|nr:VWA domain-containing protein [Thermoguttaceae bacterium]MDD4788624.1 VWA domain-containing protein [Pirellulales bacterium]NLZ03150.1 VWA domain-containing protein [Pirellulaceae bacterium]
MSDFRFANPDWSVALWLVAAVAALLVWLDWRRGDVLARFLSATMQPRLVHRLSRTRRWLSIGLLALSAAWLVVALMRPQWGLTYHQMPRVGAQIMVCLDVSKSMLAEDTAPSRLGRAKAELDDLLAYLEGDQVGLIAFAGRAAVLCPLTPDFGFFRLVLDGAGPHSVGRGGTRLEEPIRKALDGFRGEADLSRVILLITDGEDHDSHPLDAAKAAAQRGVRILAIGFGDEAGSEIQLSDPRTGVRSVLRDAAGAAVVSRLDGQTLRDIALQTEGAYIPAGTGALDLKSIYEAHIAPLVRGRLDGRGRAVRREGFQWAVLCGLIFLASAVVVGNRSVAAELAGAAYLPAPVKTRAGAAALAIVLTLAAVGRAQQDAVPQEPAEPPANGVAEAPPTAAASRPESRAAIEEKPPRELYNEALACLDSDPDRAERLLAEARRRSATDGEVRFRAAYNMGWVEVSRAERRIGDRPQDALAHLRRAADWFRDCVRLRPEHADARHNLEVVLRRVLELADSLAKTEDQDLAERLDGLVGAERSVVAAARGLVEQAAEQADAGDADALRSRFRDLAVRQRQVLSDCQALSASARQEADRLEARGEQERTPQDNLRLAQLAAVLHYAGRAEQRMGQARSQMRLRQADRAFRRTAAALDELKRSRDQLRGPVEILDLLLADAISLARLTALKAAAAGGLPGADPKPLSPPPWLTGEYLSDGQLAVTERTAELAARLQAGLDGEDPPGTPDRGGAPVDAQADRFLAAVRQAMPLLNQGREAFEAAGQALAAGEFRQAGDRQFEAIEALGDARERFLQLRGLIELAYARQAEIRGLLAAGQSGHSPPEEEHEPEPAPPPNAKAARLARQLQSENLDRAERIAALLKEDIAALEAAPATGPLEPGQPAADPADRQTAERQRIESANKLLDSAKREMNAASEALAGLLEKPPAAEQPDGTSAQSTGKTPRAEEPAAAPPLDPARQHAAQALTHLQELRRLFFSIIEHLREAAQRQAQLNDETEQAAGSGDKETLDQKTGPLALRQKELGAVAERIAGVLGEQAKQTPAGAADPQQADPGHIDQMQQIAARLGKAAALVAEGGTAMHKAADALAAEGPRIGDARTSQDQALETLGEALALLQPPQPGEEDPPDQQPEGEDQQAPQDGADPQQQQQAGQVGADPARLLQAIRDREAQRRRDRQERQHYRQDPVEKDW